MRNDDRMNPMLRIITGFLLVFPFVNPAILNQEEENHLPLALIKETVESGSMVAEYVWSVRNIRQLLSSKDGALVGPEFYTGRPGYKIRLSLTAGQVNPVDGLSYLGLWFNLAPGLYDEILEWPFPYTLNLTLLDRRKPRLKPPDHHVPGHGNNDAVLLGPQLSSQQSDTGYTNYGYPAVSLSQIVHDQRGVISRPPTDPRSKNNQIQDSTFPNHPLPEPEFGVQGINSPEFQKSGQPNERIRESQILDPSSRYHESVLQDSGYLNPRQKESVHQNRKQGDFESGFSNSGNNNPDDSVFLTSASSHLRTPKSTFVDGELKENKHLSYSMQYPTHIGQASPDARIPDLPFSNTGLQDNKRVDSLSSNPPLVDSTIPNFRSLSHGHLNTRLPNKSAKISDHKDVMLPDGGIENSRSFSRVHRVPLRLKDSDSQDTGVSLDHENHGSRILDDQIKARNSLSQVNQVPSKLTDIHEADVSLEQNNPNSNLPDYHYNRRDSHLHVDHDSTRLIDIPDVGVSERHNIQDSRLSDYQNNPPLHVYHSTSRLPHQEFPRASLAHTNQDSSLPNGQNNGEGSSSQLPHGPPRLENIQDSGVPLQHNNQDSRLPSDQINPPLHPHTLPEEVDRSIHLTINPTSALCRLRKQFLRPRNKRRGGGGCGKGFLVPLRRLEDFVSADDEILVRVTVFLQRKETPSPKSARVLMRGHQLVSEFQWNVNEPSSEQGGRVSSAPFSVNSESYVLVLRMSLGPDIGLFVTLVPGQFDSGLQWPFAYAFELAVADMAGNERRISVDPTSGTCPLQAFTRPRHRPNPPCGFRKLTGLARNGSLAVKFTAVLDQMPHFAKLAVKEGFLVAEYVWRVPNIERKMQLARSDRLSNLLSERFYSQPQGYLLQLQLKFQRSGNTSLSAGLFLTLLESAHDPLLEWPFSRRFQLRVVDQGGGEDIVLEVDPRDPRVTGEACAGSFWRPFGRNDACGSSSAATHDQLYDRKFIRYGAILLKVVIFLDEIRPPRFAALAIRENHLTARFEWRVPDLASKIRQSKDVPYLDSDKFYLSNNGYRMMLRLYPEKAAGYAGLYAVLVRGAHDDELRWPFPHTFRLEVRAGPTGKAITRTTHPGESGSGCPDIAFRRPDRELAEWSCGEGRMVAHRTLGLPSPEGASESLFAVEVFLEEFANPPVASLRIDPRGSSLVSKYSWVLKDASGALQLLRSGEKEILESPVFYTENQGYALRISLSAGGSSKEDIGLFWTLQRGQYDDALLWPFRGPVTLSFVDKNGVKQVERTTLPDRGNCPLRAFERPSESHNRQSCGFPDVVSMSSLLSAFIYDDVLHVQATVLLT